MGYSSNIVIGVHKEIMVRDLISREIPKYLREEPPKQIEDFFYWNLDWKWYSSDPEIQAIIAWFHLLAAEDEEQQLDPQDPTVRRPIRFGAIRMGEDTNDTDTWGEPEELGIYTVHCISHPGQ